MHAQRLQHERANPRLARAVARDEGEAGLCCLSRRGAPASHRLQEPRHGRNRGTTCWPAPPKQLSKHKPSPPSRVHPPHTHARTSTHTTPSTSRGPAADDPLSMLRDEEEADSDEEWKGIKERAAARHEVKTAPQAQQRQQQQKKRAAEDEERPEEDHAERSDKASGRCGACLDDEPCSRLELESAARLRQPGCPACPLHPPAQSLPVCPVGHVPNGRPCARGCNPAMRARVSGPSHMPPLFNPAGLQGEDWEHEDVAADDDLDMGEGEEEEVAGSPTRRWGNPHAPRLPVASGMRQQVAGAKGVHGDGGGSRARTAGCGPAVPCNRASPPCLCAWTATALQGRQEGAAVLPPEGRELPGHSPAALCTQPPPGWHARPGSAHLPTQTPPAHAL